jgi:hypothetical protein
MPNRWPITSGNWSNAAIWSGSLIPTASDDVFTNNQIVFVDTDVTIRSIRNSTTGSAISSNAQANCFYLNNGVTLTTTAGGVIGAVNNFAANAYFPTIIVSGSSSARIVGTITIINGNQCCAVIVNNGASLSVTGSINGSLSTPGATTARTIWMNSSGSLNMSGSVLAGTSTQSGGTIFITAAANVNINGNLIGATNIGGSAVYNESTALVIVTGSVAGSNERANTTVITNFSTGTIIVSGSILGGSLGSGITNSSTGTIQITGSITGGTGVVAISNASTGNVFVTGSIQAGLGASAISSTTNGVIRVFGPVSSSTAIPGVQSSGTTAVNAFTGPFYNTNGRNAVYAQTLQLISGSTPTWTFDTETVGEQRTLYTADFPGNFPSTSNVRQGTVFGNTGQFTGTVAIPSASNVLKGVPVDSTTGSASFTTQNVWGVSTGSLTATGSIGERLVSASTVAIDAELITLTGTL